MEDRDPEAGRRLQAAIAEASGRRSELQLSKDSGVSRSVLRNWRLGVAPGVPQMRRVADALGVPVEILWLRWLGYDAPEPGLAKIANEISELRDAILDAATRRGVDAERRDWEAAQDQDPEDDGEPGDEPGRLQA